MHQDGNVILSVGANVDVELGIGHCCTIQAIIYPIYTNYYYLIWVCTHKLLDLVVLFPGSPSPSPTFSRECESLHMIN